AAGCPSEPDSVRARRPAPAPARRSSPPAVDNPRPAGRRGRASCSSRCPRPRGPEDRSRPRPRRKRERERAPLARLALDPDAAAVQLDESFGQRQSEACPFPLVGAGLRLLELLEDPFLILGCDAGPRVGNQYAHLTVEPRRLEIDVPARRRELHRVRKEVEDHLPNPPLVALDDFGGRIELERELDAGLRRTPPYHHDPSFERLPQRERLDLELHLARLDLREVQHV